MIEIIENRIKELMAKESVHHTLKSAMNYSITAGGKRLRPMLNIYSNQLLDGNMSETLDIACAIEMIHTYSLIHDDLPAMDNDELRRGKPTCHIMFSEAYAILAGDGLLNYAFEVMIANAQRYTDNVLSHLKAIATVANGAGVENMLSGQSADIENEGQILTSKELEYVHSKKTAAMIKGALTSGILLCNPTQTELDAVSGYGDCLGLTFQIVDDVLDITGDKKTLGKTPGKDSVAKKFTFPTLYGVEGSLKIAKEKTQEAVEKIGYFGIKGKVLADLATNILSRTK